MVDEGQIRITIRQEGDDILLSVEDNGIGMTQEKCREILHKEPGDRTGIGIKNVNDRIKIYFGEKYGLTITSELDEGPGWISACQRSQRRTMMENKKRTLLAVLFLLFCLLGIAALYGQARQPAEGTSGHSSNRQKVTLIAKSTESAFWKSVFAGASAAGTEYNMELLCQGADNEEDYKSQNQMIDNAVADGADAILFSAIDYEENAAAIDRAAEAGVRIIVIDSDVNSDQVECRIGTDNYRAGCLAGEAALDSDASALNVGIVNFDATTENGQSREKGFRDTIFQDDRVTLIDSVNSNSTIAAAKEATLQMLAAHPEINVLTTFNEWTTLGVGYAIREPGPPSASVW